MMSGQVDTCRHDLLNGQVLSSDIWMLVAWNILTDSDIGVAKRWPYESPWLLCIGTLVRLYVDVAAGPHVSAAQCSDCGSLHRIATAPSGVVLACIKG
jgi:hypothetical protein